MPPRVSRLVASPPLYYLSTQVRKHPPPAPPQSDQVAMSRGRFIFRLSCIWLYRPYCFFLDRRISLYARWRFLEHTPCTKRMVYVVIHWMYVYNLANLSLVYYLKTRDHKNMMRFLILLCLCMVSVDATCPVSHAALWACALKDQCVNVYQLHAKTRKKKIESLQRPFILAMEGPKYRRLFEDCDTNKDGCLDKEDVLNPKCTRSCMWRKTMHRLLC